MKYRVKECFDLEQKFIGNTKVRYNTKGPVQYVQFENMLPYQDIFIHCFTTRHGGVSTGEYTSLNLGIKKNDPRENIDENYQRICNAVGIEIKNLVLSDQIHDCKIRRVDEVDRGKGICRESDIIGYDGLVTDRKEVALVTFYADCVPLFFADPKAKVVGMAHSGWRGTLKGIGAEMVKTMKEHYGCQEGDIEVAIGPSIGGCCFEVGEEVVQEFVAKWPWSEIYCKRTGDHKWHMDLQEVIKQSLMLCGIDEKKILISGICTKCNKELFFSHRGDQGKTGILAGIMQLV